MKRNVWTALLCILLLTGCVHAEGSYADQLNMRMERAITGATAGPTYSHGIYSYYKEPAIGRVSSEALSSTFIENGVRFIMNLNVPAIVNEKYYGGAASSGLPRNMDTLAESRGTFADFEGEVHPFEVKLFELEGDQVFACAKTDLLEFYAICGKLEALQVSETMIRIARTVRVDHDAVISAYSSRQEINYERKRLELFQNIVPENGAIEELFEGNGNYAGVADNYYGDNITDEPVQGGTINPSTGDADDQIGAPFTDEVDVTGDSEEGYYPSADGTQPTPATD